VGQLGIELVGLLAKFFQEAARLFGDKHALDAAIDRVRLPKHEARRLQTIDQRSHANLADVEFIGKLGLRKSVFPRDECQHPPLRPCDAERGEGAIEHHPA